MLDVEIVRQMYINLERENHHRVINGIDNSNVEPFISALAIVLGDDCPTWHDIWRGVNNL